MDDVLVLDRDGVINVDLMTYVTRPEDFEPIKGSLEAIALLNKFGFKVAIATNQACIEKKIITDTDLLEIHDYMKDLLKEVGGEGLSYFKPNNDTEIKEKIEEMVYSEENIKKAISLREICNEEVEKIFQNYDFLAIPSQQVFPFDKNLSLIHI